MATYKLIQDIEAEDHILGPLSLRQFLFALVAVFLFYICFILLTKGVFFMLVVFLPPALFCAFFAVPFGRDQPTEIWALAKLRFWFRPRQRVWNQSGVKELVTINVPKKIEKVFTNGLDQTQVKSRLNALANTIDSRGWAVKHVDFGTYSIQPDMASDRLINLSAMPQQVPNYETYAADDILDASNNPIAKQFDTMITQSSQSHRQQLIDQLNDVAPAATPQSSTPAANNTWFAGQAAAAPLAAPVAAAPVAEDPTAEAELSEQLAERSNTSHVSLNNMHTLKTADPAAGASNAQDDQQTDEQAISDNASASVTSSGDPAIISLAKNNDLNVSTLAREAQKAKGGGDNEVVVSLH
ncbi:MAG: PrgI family protein [Patescibacteria group bacterium]